MAVLWLAVRAARALEADRRQPLTAVAARHSSGAPWSLRCWSAGPRPATDAVQVDAALVDLAGPARRVSLQQFERGRAPLFDDPAVQALLQALAAVRSAGDGPLSTLTRDSVHYAGALLAWDVAGTRPHGGAEAVARLGRLEVIDVDAGLLATRPQVLHGTQRENGQPWPAASAG